MAASHKNPDGFSAVELLIILVIIGILGVVGWQVMQHHSHGSASSGTNKTQNSQDALTSQSGRFWIMGAPAFNQVVVDAGARQALANDTIYVPGSGSTPLVSQATGLHVVPTESFTNEANLARAIAKKTIKPDTKAILYDNEHWPLTPSNEQANPLLYYQKAAALIHASGYIFIGTPVSKTDPAIDDQIAPYVDVLDIQSQYDQAAMNAYTSHVLPIAQAARKTNAKLIILSGLSTNPPAGIPTVQQLVDDAQAVNSVVQGYWLNIPAPGKACPKCQAPQPQIGIQFLNSLK